jgi:predicted GTPase
MLSDGAVDAVVAGTPVDLRRVITVDAPVVRARYALREQGSGRLEAILRSSLGL